MFQLLPMTILTKIITQQKNCCEYSTTVSKICQELFCKNLLDVKRTVFWNNFTSRCCENKCSTVPAFPPPARILQIFFFSIFGDFFWELKIFLNPLLSVIKLKTFTVCLWMCSPYMEVLSVYFLIDFSKTLLILLKQHQFVTVPTSMLEHP